MRKLHERLEALLADDRSNLAAQNSENGDSESQPEQQETMSVGSREENVETHRSPSSMQLTEMTEEVVEPSDETKHPESLAEGVLADLPAYDKDRYFLLEHRINLNRLVKSVLEHKNGITLHELTLDIAHLHGLTRSSRKQIKYLRDLIKNWAGFWRDGRETTVWLSRDDVCDEIAWRGLFAFGVEREWKDLCYQEQKGIARAAVAAQSHDPVDWMFKELRLARRHQTTVEAFEKWIERISSDEGA